MFVAKITTYEPRTRLPIIERTVLSNRQADMLGKACDDLQLVWMPEALHPYYFGVRAYDQAHIRMDYMGPSTVDEIERKCKLYDQDAPEEVQ